MKKRYLAAGVGAALLALFLAAAIWAAPLVRAVFSLRGASVEDGLQYKVSVELEPGSLTEGQGRLLGMVSALFGEDRAGLSWNVVGRARGGSLYGELFCEGISEPVTELYFSDGKGAVNVEMLYGAVEKAVVDKYPLAQHIFPDWEYGAFLSNSQLEEAFQIDLEGMFQITGMAEGSRISAWRAFWMLAGMERSKGEHGGARFGVSLGGYKVTMEFTRQGNAPVVYVQAFGEGGEPKIAECAGEFEFREVGKVVFPESFMEEQEVQQLEKLWSAAKGLMH